MTMRFTWGENRETFQLSKVLTGASRSNSPRVDASVTEATTRTSPEGGAVLTKQEVFGG